MMNMKLNIIKNRLIINIIIKYKFLKIEKKLFFKMDVEIII